MATLLKKEPKKEKRLMTQDTIVQGDLLYHAVHGLCRVDQLTKQKQAGKEVRSYSLVPKVTNKMKIRFTITDKDMVASGFHALVSTKEANEILEYFKAGDITAVPRGVEPKALPDFAQDNQTWGLAQALLSFSHDNMEIKDQRKRQMLERSAKGLLTELSFVFKTSLKETAVKVRKSLASAAKVNPLVLAAIENACED